MLFSLVIVGVAATMVLLLLPGIQPVNIDPTLEPVRVENRNASTRVSPIKDTRKPAIKPVKQKPKKSQTKAVQSWKEHIIRTCMAQNISMHSDELVPGSFKHIYVDDKTKVLYCAIPKVASTTWKRILLVTSGKSSYQKSAAIPQPYVHKIFSGKMKSLASLPIKKIFYALNNYFKFMIVRDPFERVLSAYRDKLWNATARVKAFQKGIGKYIIRKYRKNPSKLSLEYGHDVLFQEFVNFLTDRRTSASFDPHWKPFYRMCRPCWIQYDFVSKLSQVEKDAAYILKKLGKANEVQFPHRTELYSLPKSESLVQTYFSNITQSSMNKLYNIYKLDYIFFNFSKPFVKK